MNRMRTIDQAAAYVRERDGETALTKTALRRLIVTGRLPHVQVGNKYLLDLDTLEDFLHGETAPQAPAAVNGIRPVSVR